ncbi:hypothetical protein [Cohnella yongneupensis]|uniref:Uncharacterized protein n=1 Tax=Cohnella yongneupensis TaxID=425006 RepID=A0ABW0R6K1_9BACL
MIFGVGMNFPAIDDKQEDPSIIGLLPLPYMEGTKRTIPGWYSGFAVSRTAINKSAA